MTGKQIPIILVVDDLNVNRELIIAYLEEEGYGFLEASNGKMAVEIATKKQPDLILLDIIMPVMDGYEVCRLLKTSKLTKHIPIIFVTSLNEVRARIAATEAGGDDYLFKPFNIYELSAKIKSFLNRKEYNEEILEEERVNTVINITKGLTHELNQPLLVLGSITQRMLRKIDKNHLNEISKPNYLKETFTQMKQSIDRMSQLVEQFRILNRSDRKIISEINLTKVLDNSFMFYGQQLLQRGIQLDNQLEDNLIVLANEVNIQTVFMNLIQNSRDAFDELENQKINKEKKIIKIYSEKNEKNNKLNIYFIDNGIGIKKDDLDKIFTLFESSKKDKGMGIGLNTCLSIMQSVWGDLTITSSYKKETHIKVTFPLNYKKYNRIIT